MQSPLAAVASETKGKGESERQSHWSETLFGCCRSTPANYRYQRDKPQAQKRHPKVPFN
jgi:hypothetical protein